MSEPSPAEAPAAATESSTTAAAPESSSSTSPTAAEEAEAGPAPAVEADAAPPQHEDTDTEKKKAQAAAPVAEETAAAGAYRINLIPGGQFTHTCVTRFACDPIDTYSRARAAQGGRGAPIPRARRAPPRSVRGRGGGTGGQAPKRAAAARIRGAAHRLLRAADPVERDALVGVHVYGLVRSKWLAKMVW